MVESSNGIRGGAAFIAMVLGMGEEVPSNERPEEGEDEYADPEVEADVSNPYVDEVHGALGISKAQMPLATLLELSKELMTEARNANNRVPVLAQEDDR